MKTKIHQILRPDLEDVLTPMATARLGWAQAESDTRPARIEDIATWMTNSRYRFFSQLCNQRLCQNRTPLVPVGGLLIGIGYLKQQVFLKHIADELHANR